METGGTQFQERTRTTHLFPELHRGSHGSYYWAENIETSISTSSSGFLFTGFLFFRDTFALVFIVCCATVVVVVYLVFFSECYTRLAEGGLSAGVWRVAVCERVPSAGLSRRHRLGGQYPP